MLNKSRAALILTAICMPLISGQASAQTSVETLGSCLADNTSGKDRKELAKWLFAAMTAHPEMKSLTSATSQDIHSASKSAGEIFTRLMADSCAKQVRDAVQTGGPAAIQAGFQVLGQLAMQELMTNAQVGAAMGVLDQYIDKARVDAALQAK